MTDEELVKLVATAEEWTGRPFTTAAEIAERAGMSRQGVRQRLEKLVGKKDNLRRYKPARDVIYWQS